MPDDRALLLSVFVVFGVALMIPVARIAWRRSPKGRQLTLTVARATALRTLQSSGPGPMIQASLAQLRGVSDRLSAVRNTTVGLFSREMRDAQLVWQRELEVREALVSSVAYALYGEFDRARDLIANLRLSASPVLPLLALQPEFLLQTLEERDFKRAAVTAHQGRDLANARSLDADAYAPYLRKQWETYLLVAQVLAGDRAGGELRQLVESLSDAHLEVISRWALVTLAARNHDIDRYEQEHASYRRIAPHCASPESPDLRSASTRPHG